LIWTGLFKLGERKYMTEWTVWKLEVLIKKHRRTIYRWEALGLIPKAKRDKVSKYRVWDEQAVKKIKEFVGMK
jgi:hypothetical protein